VPGQMELVGFRSEAHEGEGEERYGWCGGQVKAHIWAVQNESHACCIIMAPILVRWLGEEGRGWREDGRPRPGPREYGKHESGLVGSDESPRNALSEGSHRP